MPFLQCNLSTQSASQQESFKPNLPDYESYTIAFVAVGVDTIVAEVLMVTFEGRPKCIFPDLDLELRREGGVEVEGESSVDIALRVAAFLGVAVATFTKPRFQHLWKRRFVGAYQISLSVKCGPCML